MATADLSPELEARIAAIFKQIDSDGSNALDMEEVAKWWGNQEHAEAMFKAIDVNGDGELSLEEVLLFFQKAKGSGKSEEEISQEVAKFEAKASWVNL